MPEIPAPPLVFSAVDIVPIEDQGHKVASVDVVINNRLCLRGMTLISRGPGKFHISVPGQAEGSPVHFNQYFLLIEEDKNALLETVVSRYKELTSK